MTVAAEARSAARDRVVQYPHPLTAPLRPLKRLASWEPRRASAARSRREVWEPFLRCQVVLDKYAERRWLMVWIIGAICMIFFGAALVAIGWSMGTLGYAIVGGALVLAGIVVLVSIRRSWRSRGNMPRLR
jgi:hypothetical protein